MNLRTILTPPAEWCESERNLWPAFAALILTRYYAERTVDAYDHTDTVVNVVDGFARTILGCRAGLDLCGFEDPEDPQWTSTAHAARDLVLAVADVFPRLGGTDGIEATAAVTLVFCQGPHDVATDGLDANTWNEARTARRFCREARRILRRLPKAAPQATVARAA